VRIVK